MVNHQYITEKAKEGFFFVEGTYNEEFVKFIRETVPKEEREYQGGARRWRINNLKYMPKIIDRARQEFSTVYFSRGGEYEEVTMGGMTYYQSHLFRG